MGQAVCKRPCYRAWAFCASCCCCRRCPARGERTEVTLQRQKRFVSTCSYVPRTSQDLRVQKGETFQVLVDYGDWMFVEQGERQGYVPKAITAAADSLEANEWYFGQLTKMDAKRFLLQPQNRDGAFLVWRNAEVDCYYLSVRIKRLARHYQILQSSDNCYYLVPRKQFHTLEKLVRYYSRSADGLCVKLELPCVKLDTPSMPSLAHDTIDHLEIQPDSIQRIKKLGSGSFGNVWLAKWNGTTEVAIKELQASSESVKNLMKEEAENLWRLNNERVLKLYAVCLRADPVFIVTEYMRNGSLRNYLRDHKAQKDLDFNTLVDFSVQITQGMDYMESMHCVHRDLRSDNILLTEMLSCKIGDFGLATFSDDNCSIELLGDMRLPIKWMAPEVFNMMRYSSKSDVWSFGVLLVEIMTYGEDPFPDLNNQEYIAIVRQGLPLPTPEDCPPSMVEIMRLCWTRERDRRPSFKQLEKELTKMIDAGLVEDSLP